MRALKLTLFLCAVAAGNFSFQYYNSQDWALAIIQTVYQWEGVLIYALFLKIDNKLAGCA